MLGHTETALLECLKWAICDPKKRRLEKVGREIDFDKFILTAKKHAVLSFLYDVFEESEVIAKEQKLLLKQSASVTVRTNYRLLFLTKYIMELFRKNKIRAVVLKGVATATFYPVPELRKSGDVDILVSDKKEFLSAVKLLEREGFLCYETQTSLHHIELGSEEGISVELHSSLVEPFESQRVNRYLDGLVLEFGEHIETDLSWGIEIERLTDAYHAFYLVLHMLQHFLRAGFGLKFLCDWAVFWNRSVPDSEKKIFMRLVKESGTEGFVTVLTTACVRYLGLDEKNVSFILESGYGPEEDTAVFIEEVFAAGEFGRSKRSRMVAMRGTGVWAYVREFHHQMNLNYPESGRFFVLWPILWSLTFGKFIYNNHAVRKIRGRDVIKEAGKRSRLIYRMKLFSDVYKTQK